MADNNSLLSGSICLSDIPKSQMRKVMCKDGKERIYLNVAVITKKQPQTFTSENGVAHTYTHFITCAPKKEERIDGVNYILGDLETRTFTPQSPTPEDVANAPSIAPGENPDLPF
ncbi:hypothetical protein NF347_08940 [Paramuribaculum intestinale]|jgi:hypothetical protein|uniref:hypothetical protein n=1 Tax=Paramuribaculum intestinale TaxID=2094151 RepID=UPI001F0BAE08|nr:hypothetical protein [Paramuribaculum intestinale]WLT41111.1 hypothetical protein NF347_08940 [Paramuribaculum intestinale]